MLQEHEGWKQVQAAWAQYKEAVAAGGNPQALYQEMVWPHLLALWRVAPPVVPERMPFRASLHTLGTSPEATALAILGTGAREVYVLHTEESRRFLERLRQDTGVDIYPIEIGKSDVAAIYREVRRLLERYPEDPVALDVTSGTKAMSAGLAAAGFFFRRFFPEVKVVYVDNEDYDVALRRPRAGSERLIVLPDPHEVGGEVDWLFASELYGKEDFVGAAAYFQRLVGNTGNQAYTLYGMLAELYRAWRALDFKEAARKAESLLEALSRNVWLQHPLNRHFQRLRRQAELLQAARDLLVTADLGNRQGVLAVAATLLYLSERYGKRGQTTLAALHAYRALELLLQERLRRFGRLAEAPGLSPEEAEALAAELGRILPGDEPPRVRERLGLLEVLAFLRVLGDPLLASLEVRALQGLAGVLKARNQALLVHGLQVPTEKQVEQVAALARRLLQDLQGEVGVQPDLEAIPLPR
ncbi:TIGR02710 family CRISPR-associated CARF protein [Thermus sp. 93170]|jgi:CRISPR-associated protein (TIGR02710 family)|uniref:TIGR02710 family CRISPR-associated CARF protein n=1 Tax=Thermus sp. 93170 TaxID=1046939 RepID=UPI0031FB0B17